jgi:phosphoribosylamine--glycine ligase
MEEVIRPTLAGLRADGIDYLGFLYAGLIITAGGTPKVLEFNCRFGDPETQPIMTRLHTDLVEICEATLSGKLADITVDWDPRAALGVVMAAGGYPDSYRTGDAIEGLPDTRTGAVKVFHAGTAMRGDTVLTSGGRVLCVVGLGATVAEAQEMAYSQVRRIHWPDVYYRSDIGHRAIAGGRSTPRH